MHLFSSPAIVATTVAILTLAPTAASAFDKQITFCNKTSRDVYVALAYDLSGTSQITSKGWYETRGCTCRTVLNADLRATEVFFLVTREGLENIVGDAQAGICVHPSDSFTYRSENADRASCEKSGGAWAFFKWKDTGGNASYTYSVSSQGECNMMGDN